MAAGFVRVLALVALAVVQGEVPTDLATMAETEREFARTATVKGWRDAFLDFFADDSIAFTPDVASAKDRLRKQPARPFSEFELVWEPRVGDVAASGDLGWLTGPSTSLNHTNADKKRGYGCYLSVWRKQPDGTWRVFIDVGADAPEPVRFAPGFNRIAFGSRYAGKDGKAASTASLAAADRDLNSEVASLGPGRAFETRLSPASRLHRPGTLPIAGRDAVTAWMRSHATAGSATHSAAEASIAGDFGYTYGRFETSGPQPSAGVYIRLWSRDASGRWWLMVDVAQPFKPRP